MLAFRVGAAGGQVSVKTTGVPAALACLRGVLGTMLLELINWIVSSFEVAVSV